MTWKLYCFKREIKKAFVDDKFVLLESQDDDSGLRIRVFPVGTVRKDAVSGRNRPGGITFPTEIHRMMEAVFRLGNVQIFLVTSDLSLLFPTGNHWKSLEKIRAFPDRNTASMKSPEILVAGRFLVGFFDLGLYRFNSHMEKNIFSRYKLLILRINGFR